MKTWPGQNLAEKGNTGLMTSLTSLKKKCNTFGSPSAVVNGVRYLYRICV